MVEKFGRLQPPKKMLKPQKSLNFTVNSICKRHTISVARFFIVINSVTIKKQMLYELSIYI